MDKIIERGLLFDFYGELLTAHQQKIYSEAVFNDMSLSELSEEEGISRQGIHDIIKRCDKQLEQYESALKLIERFQTVKNKVTDIRQIVEESNGLAEEVRKDILNKLNEIIKDL